MNPFTYVPGAVKYSFLTALLARANLGMRTRGVRKFIFTATTGRSGTLALAKLFAAVPDCHALHEPFPVMNENVLHDANAGAMESLRWTYARIKAINIRRAAVGYRYYLEANHLFVKTFIEQAIEDLGARLEVIHLVRNPLDVALSIVELQDEPGTERGNRWWLDYRAPLNRIRIAAVLDGDPGFSHPLYKALWYWFEVEARIREWRERFPRVPFHRFETEWLNDRARVLDLFERLQIPVDEAHLAERIGAREHARTEQKSSPGLAPDEAQRMLERFEGLLRERGLLRSRY